jgi:hypothetical protein
MLATQTAARTRHNGNTPFEINAHKTPLQMNTASTQTAPLRDAANQRLL